MMNINVDSTRDKTSHIVINLLSRNMNVSSTMEAILNIVQIKKEKYSQLQLTEFFQLRVELIFINSKGWSPCYPLNFTIFWNLPCVYNFEFNIMFA